MLKTLSALHESQPRAVPKLMAALGSERRHHAFLLVGGHAHRRLEIARAMGASLICQQASAASAQGQSADACGQCLGCSKFAEGNHPDVVWVLPNDKGRIPIDAIRALSGRLGMRVSEASSKVVIVHGADLMNPQAQNALLKTLEEPPGPTCFLLTSRQRRALLPTIRSRSQMVQLAPMESHRAWENLLAAGLNEATARALGPVVGDDGESANKLALGPAPLVLEALGKAFGAMGKPSVLLPLAAELGGEKERFDLSLKVLETLVRDGLALHFQSDSSLLYQALGAPHSLPFARWAAGSEKLREARRIATFNPNRTLVMEGVLLALLGEMP